MLIIYFASITCIFFKLVLQFLKFLAASSFSKTLSMTNTNMVNLASVPLLVLFLSILYLLFMFRHVCFVPPSSCCFLCLECTYLFLAWLTLITLSQPNLLESFCCPPPCLVSVLAQFLVQTWEDFSAFLLPEITFLKKKIMSDGFAAYSFSSGEVFLKGLPGMGGEMAFGRNF